MLPVAILAGGLATRLGSLAKDRPKSLVDVCGKPFVAHQLELLTRHGVTDVVFCVGHLGEQIEAAIGDGGKYGVRARYSYDGAQRMGTGGALRKALSLIDSPFFVLYGDSYLECDYSAIAASFIASGRLGLMTVLRNNGQWDRSNVLYAEGRIVQYDKAGANAAMAHIDYGLSVFDSRAFERFPSDQPFDLVAVYQDLLARGELAAFEVTTRFYEIGGEAGLEETRQHLSS